MKPEQQWELEENGMKTRQKWYGMRTGQKRYGMRTGQKWYDMRTGQKWYGMRTRWKWCGMEADIEVRVVPIIGSDIGYIDQKYHYQLSATLQTVYR